MMRGPYATETVDAMSIVFLVRHGQATFNGALYDRLSDLGRRQSVILGDFFAASGRCFDACFAGTMERQRKTAEIILERMDRCGETPALQIVPELNEHDTPAIIKAQIPELARLDRSFADSLAAFRTDRLAAQRVLETALLRWARGEATTPGVESWTEFKARVRDGMQRSVGALAPDARALVVTSGGPLAAVMHWALGLDDETAMRLEWRVRNAATSTFKIADGRAELMSFNSTAYLEAHGEPGLMTYL
jgi:broad specificity phosphatase PhoE